MQGYEKYRDFRPTSLFISEMIQDRAIVTMECEYETVPKLSKGIILNDREWSWVVTQGHSKWYYTRACWWPDSVQTRYIYRLETTISEEIYNLQSKTEELLLSIHIMSDHFPTLWDHFWCTHAQKSLVAMVSSRKLLSELLRKVSLL